MTILTYLSCLIASLVSGGRDDHHKIFKLPIASHESGGSDDHSNTFK